VRRYFIPMGGARGVEGRVHTDRTLRLRGRLDALDVHVNAFHLQQLCQNLVLSELCAVVERSVSHLRGRRSQRGGTPPQSRS
jgi:hypothetical protein